MKLIVVSILLVMLTSNLALSQVAGTASNSIHLELLGNGLIYSLNYERIIIESLSARAGIGYIQVNEIGGDDKVSLTTVPVMVNYLLGSKSSHLELGIGACFIVASADFKEFASVSGSETLGTATFGYRYQRPDGGILFRAGVTPLFGSIGFQLWFGLGFGYAF